MRLQAGRPAPEVGGFFRTNDRGEYSSNDLRPGRYVVLASYSGQYDRSSGLSPRHALAVFYPASPSPASAGIVDVRTRAEAMDIDIVLQEDAGVVVEGIVERTAAFPAGSEANLVLQPVDSRSEFIAAARTKTGETFKFTGIPEGRYLLLSNSRDASRQRAALDNSGEDRYSRYSHSNARRNSARSEIRDGGNGERTNEPFGRFRVTGPEIPLAPTIVTRGWESALGPYGMTTSRIDKDGRLMHTGITDGATYAMEFPAGCQRTAMSPRSPRTGARKW